MSRNKPYAFKRCSVIDIKKWVESKGFQLQYFQEGKSPEMLQIVGTDIFIDFPIIDRIDMRVFGEIRFEDYPKTPNYEKSKKLYEALKRKFAIKDQADWNQHAIDKVKDLNEVEKLKKELKKKSGKDSSFWPFNKKS